MPDIEIKFDDFIKAIPQYEIEIGVLSGNAKRKEKIKIGLTNAELMFIHENGSTLRHIPARPVLRMTLDWAKKSGLVINTLMKCFAYTTAYSKERAEVEIDKEMNKMCLKLQNYARQIIYLNDGRLVPNAPSTIAQKGVNHPLFNTGQLARSITCRAIKL